MARDVLDLLPAAVDRCTAIAPARLTERERPLAARVSQSEPLPWTLSLPVEAYERGERYDAQGRRAVLEYVRFEAAPRPRIEAELERVLQRSIVWDERADSDGAGCAGELTCTPTIGRFVDPRTVRLMRGKWGELSEGGASCARLLARDRAAIEVSSRVLEGTEGEPMRAELRIVREPLGFSRHGTKRFPDPGSAARALDSTLTGADELPMFAGVPATSFGLRRGASVEQRSFVSFDELELRVADETRAASLHRLDRLPPLEQVDPRDVEAVKASYDARRSLVWRAADGSSELAGPLDALLASALALTPEDEGLLRRRYELQREVLRDPGAALALAEQALSLGVGDASAWQLRKRGALALLDDARLRGELARAHGLPKEAAARMARELVHKARAGDDYERAEWAFLAARRLGEAERDARAALPLHVPLNELPRLFALLARSVDEGGDVGVQVLLVAGREQPPARAEGQDGPWLARTEGGGRAGLVMAATTWDIAQLAQLGEALLRATQDGPLELRVGIEQLGGDQSATFALSGQRRGAELAIESGSRALARVRWHDVERLLLRPLSALTGATYPPDPLVVEARDGDELLQVTRAAEREARVRCTSEALVVQCRGALSDPGAAARALLSVSRTLLRAEGRALWSPRE